MPQVRFSLKWLFGIVAMAAFGCAALANANLWWSTGTYSVAIGLMILATIASVLKRGRVHAFWLGFTIAGAGYLYAASLNKPAGSFGSSGLENSRDGRLITTQLLDRIYQRWILKTRAVAQPALGGGGFGGGGFGGGGMPAGFGGQSQPLPGTATGGRVPPMVPSQVVVGSTLEEFTTVGHSLFAIAFAFIGGWLGKAFYAANRNETKRDKT